MTNIFGLENKVVVVTGSSGGVGRATALLFAKVAKAKVALISRRGAEGLAAEIAEFGGTTKNYCADISDRDQVQQTFKEINADLGAIHSLLNIAGTCEFYTPDMSPIDRVQIDDQRWDKIIGVNGKGPALAIEYAAKYMPEGSSIVNVGSTAGRYGAEVAVVDYTFAKAGLVGLTMAYAKILGPLGIRVNGVAPGPIQDTEMLSAIDKEALENLQSQTKLGKLCKPADIAKINLFLASDMSSVMTGDTVDANCGQYINF